MKHISEVKVMLGGFRETPLPCSVWLSDTISQGSFSSLQTSKDAAMHRMI